MVSDFVDEHNGFLALSDSEYEWAKVLNPRIRKYAQECFEYRESKEGYWTWDKFISQISNHHCRNKIPQSKWMVDQSSCHAAMANDALDVTKMNMKPGGKQRIKWDTVWDGKVWKLHFTNSSAQKVAMGMKMVLEERGVATEGWSANWMRKTLGDFDGVKNEKSMIERMLIEKGATSRVFSPNFTLNSIPLRGCGHS